MLFRFWIAALLVAMAVVGVAFPPTQPHRLKISVSVKPLDWADKDYVDGYPIPEEIKDFVYQQLIRKLLDSGEYLVLESETLDAPRSAGSLKWTPPPAQVALKCRIKEFDVQNRSARDRYGLSGSIGNIYFGKRTSISKAEFEFELFDVDSRQQIAKLDTSDRKIGAPVTLHGHSQSIFRSQTNFQGSALGRLADELQSAWIKFSRDTVASIEWTGDIASWDPTAKEVTIGSGTDAGVQEDDAFEVYRKEQVIRDPKTGDVLGHRTKRVGEVRIVRAEKRFSVGTVIDGDGFQIGDVVRVLKP